VDRVEFSADTWSDDASTGYPAGPWAEQGEGERERERKREKERERERERKRESSCPCVEKTPN